MTFFLHGKVHSDLSSAQYKALVKDPKAEPKKEAPAKEEDKK